MSDKEATETNDLFLLNRIFFAEEHAKHAQDSIEKCFECIEEKEKKLNEKIEKLEAMLNATTRELQILIAFINLPIGQQLIGKIKRLQEIRNEIEMFDSRMEMAKEAKKL